jgi:outer membrane protein OmpA-like peptidoglycan-associated protein
MQILRASLSCILLFLSMNGCAPAPYPGPDKQGAGNVGGMMVGATSGAVTGFQLGAATGPGAFAGAGLGALAGGIKGAFIDRLEERQSILRNELAREGRKANALKMLLEHYQRRMRLHPSRDLFPADIFFEGDSKKVSDTGIALLQELAKLSESRAPWSRLGVVSYLFSNEQSSEYARITSNERAKAVGNALVRFGVEPRRIAAQGVVIDLPLVKDPFDDLGRYNQGIELVVLDLR